MKIRGPIFFSFLVAGFLIAAYLPKTDVANPQKEALLMQTVMSGFSQLHYSPKEIDDSFSEALYDLYVDRIDYGRRFLTQEDLHKLSPYKQVLDDQAKNGKFEFFNLSVDLLEAALDKTQAYYREILATPFNYDEEEYLELDAEKRQFTKSDAELKEFWRKYLKYETLQRVVNAIEEQEDNGEEEVKKSFDEMEQEAREEVLEFFDDWYSRMDKLKREDRLSVYLNTFASSFDPHSEYYKPIDKENFNIRFSGRLEGIGARLQTDGDYTKVSQIIVGGPAWKGKELEENDIIMKVRQEDEAEAVDITGMVINDVVQLIRGTKGTKVTLTIKKVDGATEDITIERDIVIIEEQFAKSLIIDGKDDKKIGLINLPSFYADFQNSNGRFCSTDVAKEIEKLKAENVDGIILDLRNNGGGSLRDVVKMTGLFIEKGPIVQVKSRGRNPEVLKDSDPRVQYDGPLTVMVNSYSASASEILAAALQDYGRAVVVGSTSTFGKGTVQRFIDLDRTLRGYDDIKPLGEIKLTTQKFYRVDGGSTQLKGVEPDIVLPDNFFYIKTGEKDRENAMAWTEIDPVNYGQKVTDLSSINKIKKSSAKRVKEDATFQRVLENAKRLETQRNQTSYPLNMEAYQAFLKERKDNAEQFDDLFDNEVNTAVSNLDVDIPALDADESKKARNDNWLKSVKKDIYIHETLNIMHDMLSME
ncbi:MAG: carboxy terminal-processing peptidase [Chitinophagales bacterium]|nr:carboxy terminal-processing peptidase [Chitinophagales bacterium]